MKMIRIMMLLLLIGGMRTAHFGELVNAVRGRDVDRVKRLLREGADPYESDDRSSRNAYQRAQKIDDEEMLDLFRKYFNTQKLVSAAAEGDEDEVRKLLEESRMWRPFINWVGRVEGVTALQAAARGGYMRIVDALIEAGANINATESFDATALVHASREGRIEMVQRLLQAGADKDKGVPLLPAAARGHKDVVQFLLEQGADVNRNTWATALHGAVDGSSEEIARLLLENGADPNIKSADGIGNTPLTLAARKKNIAMASILVEAGADINAVNEKGATPLSVAVGSVDEDKKRRVALWLLNAGAKVTAGFDHSPLTILHMKKARTLSKLLSASKRGDKEKVEKILGKREYKERQLTTTFLGKGDWRDRTALYWAAEKGHAEIVDMLLDVGAWPTEADDQGDTPLHRAAASGNKEVIEKLLTIFTYIDLKNKRGETPLDVAEKKGHSDIVRLLKQRQREIEPKKQSSESSHGSSKRNKQATLLKGAGIFMLMAAGGYGAHKVYKWYQRRKKQRDVRKNATNRP